MPELWDTKQTAPKLDELASLGATVGIGSIVLAAVVPATAPKKIGQRYINTLTQKVWRAIGTSSVADWKPLN